MKTIILFLALVTALFGQAPVINNPTESAKMQWAVSHGTTTAMRLDTAPLNLTLKAGDGNIVINLRTGQVELPKGMSMPDAAVAFWLRVAQCFPECRRAMLAGDPTPPTTMWGQDWLKTQTGNASLNVSKFHFVLIGGTHGPSYELGLRSDGVVVWREVKP